MSHTTTKIVDHDLTIWEVSNRLTAGGYDQAAWTVTGEGLRGGTVTVTNGRSVLEIPPCVARDLGAALTAAAEHAEAVGR